MTYLIRAGKRRQISKRLPDLSSFFANGTYTVWTHTAGFNGTSSLDVKYAIGVVNFAYWTTYTGVGGFYGKPYGSQVQPGDSSHRGIRIPWAWHVLAYQGSFDFNSVGTGTMQLRFQSVTTGGSNTNLLVDPTGITATGDGQEVSGGDYDIGDYSGAAGTIFRLQWRVDSGAGTWTADDWGVDCLVALELP